MNMRLILSPSANSLAENTVVHVALVTVVVNY